MTFRVSSVEKRERAPVVKYVSSIVKAASKRGFFSDLLPFPSHGFQVHVALESLMVWNGCKIDSCSKDSRNRAAALAKAVAAEGEVRVSVTDDDDFSSFFGPFFEGCMISLG